MSENEFFTLVLSLLRGYPDNRNVTKYTLAALNNFVKFSDRAVIHEEGSTYISERIKYMYENFGNDVVQELNTIETRYANDNELSFVTPLKNCLIHICNNI